MKKLLVISFLSVFVISISYAQIIQKPTAPLKQKGIIKTIPGQPAPPPPPPSTNKSSTTGTQNVPVYSLTAVRVNIRTGNDNKEFPSTVELSLINRNTGYFPFSQPAANMRNEMKINSNTEIGLDKNSNTASQHFTLQSIQENGLSLQIVYHPNFFMDAWKIEAVSMTLEFKDQNGNPHPTLGSKTIVFNNASGFLDGSNTVLFCSTDGQLVPTTSSIR
jgi:hypothetical protein